MQRQETTALTAWKISCLCVSCPQGKDSLGKSTETLSHVNSKHLSGSHSVAEQKMWEHPIITGLGFYCKHRARLSRLNPNRAWKRCPTPALQDTHKSQEIPFTVLQQQVYTHLHLCESPDTHETSSQLHTRSIRWAD